MAAPEPFFSGGNVVALIAAGLSTTVTLVNLWITHRERSAPHRKQIYDIQVQVLRDVLTEVHSLQKKVSTIRGELNQGDRKAAFKDSRELVDIWTAYVASMSSYMLLLPEPFLAHLDSYSDDFGRALDVITTKATENSLPNRQ